MSTDDTVAALMRLHDSAVQAVVDGFRLEEGYDVGKDNDQCDNCIRAERESLVAALREALAAVPQAQEVAASDVRDALKEAVQAFLDAVDKMHDTEKWFHRYRMPYGELNKLRAALASQE